MGPAKRTPTRTLARFAVAIAALLAAATASGCIFGGEDGTVEIPDDVQTSSEDYTVLYSTLGYDSAGAKRVLIRQNDLDAVPAQGIAFGWRLADEDGRERASGLAQFAGTAWGIPLWAADFTGVDRPGEYRLLVEAPVATLATPPFRIDDYLLTRATFEAVALDNAEQRAAPVELDRGYFEGSTRDGSVYAHAHFLLGLLDAHEQRRFFLNAQQRERLLAAIQRAVDYILLLTDPATGEIAHSSDRRPFSDDPQDTIEGARALARYAVVFQQEDAARAQRAYRLARLADQWVREEAPGDYYPAIGVAISYDLFLYANDLSALEATYAAAKELVETYDIRVGAREGADPTVYFDTLHRLALDFPDHPDRDLWVDAASRNAAHYAQMLTATPFMVAPPGAPLEDAPSPAEQWDASASAPPIGEGAAGVLGNEWFLARAIDAIHIAEMTGDEGLYGIATASLLWITGLNPGVDSALVPAPRTGAPVEAASFLLALPGRSVLAWDGWEFQRRQPAGTIVGGFVSGFAYDAGVDSGDTSIVRDGLWLRAAILYEDTIHAGGAAPSAPDAASRPSSELSVTAAAFDRTPALVVRVAGPGDEPVSGAIVTISWQAAADADLAPDDAVAVTTCVTEPTGDCTVSAGEGLPLPATAAVTNVSHPRLRFEPSEALPEPVAFD